MKKPRKKSTVAGYKVIAENRRARFDFEILDTIECGLSLVGTEVKALREGRANIAESYATVEGTDVMLINSSFPIYPPAAQFNHLPDRPRRLLLKRKEINRLIGETQRKGRTLVPMKLYFNERGLVKLSLGLGMGKKTIDKRETQKKRDWNRDKARIMKERG